MHTVPEQEASPTNNGRDADALVQNIIDNIPSDGGGCLGLPAGQAHGGIPLGDCHALQSYTNCTGDPDAPDEAHGFTTFAVTAALVMMLFNLMGH